MSAKQVKPGYKRTEVGVFPEEWNVTTVKDFCSCFSGGTPSTGNPAYYGGDIPWITSSDLNAGRITNVDGRITKEGLKNSSAKLVNSGTLLFALYGATAGVCALTYVSGAINQAILAIEPQGVEKEFLFQLFQLQKDYFVGTYTQGGQPNFSGEIVRTFKISIPPHSEQTSIAAVLSDVDALLAQLDQLIAKKRDIKQAAMQQLLTGQTRLPGFSGEWEVKRLGDVAFIDPESLPSDTHPSYAFRYISLENVDAGILKNFSEITYKDSPSRARRKLQEGDVLISTVRPNLMSHLHFQESDNDWICSTGFSVVRCKKMFADPGFVYAHLFSGVVNSQIEKIITGSNYPAISSADVRNLTISFPSVEEQTAIATVLSDMDAELAALEARRDKSRVLKQGMMQELLTGRIRLV